VADGGQMAQKKKLISKVVKELDRVYSKIQALLVHKQINDHYGKELDKIEAITSMLYLIKLLAATRILYIADVIPITYTKPAILREWKAILDMSFEAANVYSRSYYDKKELDRAKFLELLDNLKNELKYAENQMTNPLLIESTVSLYLKHLK
jgi:hypothetical protein